jgi:hypothetical protein
MVSSVASLSGRLLAARLLMLAASPMAQEVPVAELEPTLRETWLRIDRAMLAGPMAETPRRVGLEGTSEPVHRTEVALVGSAVTLELGRMTADGKFVRPRLTIGRPSPELRYWMGSIGIAAERCLLPTFRGRLKRNPEDGKVGAAVLVSARCTFY